MAESVSFKAYLKRDGQEVEVRRFGIDSGAATNFMYLQGKIHSVFPSLQNDQFNLFWQDADNDYVSVGSDEELLEAFTATAVQPLKLYVKPKERQSQVPDDNQTHIGITCDGCEGPVVGRRFKCVTCPDFDLCSKCESAGQHSDHFMLRITSPIGPQMYPKFFRKMFGRPHKFFKHGMDHHMGGHHMGGHHMGAGKTRSCPFSQPERPRESRDAAGGVTDMFDFSALMEFINSLGVSMAAGQREGSEPQAQASTSQSAPAQAGTSQSAPTQEPRQRQGPANPVAYLSNIGQAITELLDPFDSHEDEILDPKPIKIKKLTFKTQKKCKKIEKKIQKAILKHKRQNNLGLAQSDDISRVTFRSLLQKRLLDTQRSLINNRDAFNILCAEPTRNEQGLEYRHEYGPLGHVPAGHKFHGHGPHVHKVHGPHVHKVHGPHVHKVHGPHVHKVYGPLGHKVHGPLGHKMHGHGPHGHKVHGHEPNGHKLHGHGPRGLKLHGHGPHGYGPHQLFVRYGCGPAVSERGQVSQQSAANHRSNFGRGAFLGTGQMSYVPELITIDDFQRADDIDGVDVSFEVRPKTTETQEAGPSAPAATEPPRTPNTGSPVVAPASAPVPSPAVTVLPTPRSTGSPGLVSTPAPASAPEIIEITPPTATARRNSDDWTLLNRESPTRNVEVAAMEVEEGRGAAQPTPAGASAMYPELPREVISVPVSSEDRKIEESVDRILAMGFNFDRKVVRDLLKGANCDIASVLEKMLSSKKQ